MWQKSSQLTPADCKRLESTFLPNSRLPSIIRHVIVAFFFPPLSSFSSATRSDLSSLNREEYSLAEGGKVGGVEYLGYSREFKSRAKSPGRLLLRANYRPTRLLPIYPRERALLGYGGRAIDGTRASARARGPPCTGMAWRTSLCVCMRVYPRVCACAEGKEDLAERRMEKEEKRHITQMRETDEARRRLPRRARSLTAGAAFSYILATTPKRANTVSFRSLAIALFGASIPVLSLFFIS